MAPVHEDYFRQTLSIYRYTLLSHAGFPDWRLEIILKESINGIRKKVISLDIIKLMFYL